MMDKISVIIPVYNSAEYLPRCILSVISQDYKNLEIIIVNDGSTDGSDGICKKFAKNDNRIVYVSQKNGGSAHARNVGISKATGKYVTFVDADDYVDENHVSSLAKDAGPTTITHVGLTSDPGRKLPYLKIKRKVSISEWYKLMMLETINVGTFPKLIPIKIAKSCLFPEGIKIGEDAFYYFEMVNKWLKDNVTVSIDTSMLTYHYTYNAKSLTNANNTVLDWRQTLDVYRQMIRLSKPDIKRYAICGYCLMCMGTIIRNCKSKRVDRELNKGLRRELSSYRHEVLRCLTVKQKAKFIVLTYLCYPFELVTTIKKHIKG